MSGMFTCAPKTNSPIRNASDFEKVETATPHRRPASHALAIGPPRSESSCGRVECCWDALYHCASPFSVHKPKSSPCAIHILNSLPMPASQHSLHLYFHV